MTVGGNNRLEGNLIKVIKTSIKNIKSDKERAEVRVDIRRLMSEFPSTLFGSNFIFAYGTLRRGQKGYNEIKALFGDEGIEYITTTRYDYTKIVDYGDFPVLLSSRTPDYTVGDIIYLSDEALDYIKGELSDDGFIPDHATLWIPSGSIDSSKVKVLSLPTFKAGEKLEKDIEDNKVRYPKIEVADWVRYQKQTKIGASAEDQNLQYALWAAECGYYD